MQLPQHCLVSAVQAIEVTDGDGPTLLAVRQIVKSSYQSHRAFENIEL
jgi:hypothetical protein